MPGPVERSLAGTAGDHAEAARQPRIADHRNYSREERASALYEELRLLPDEELLLRWASDWSGREQRPGRAEMITVIIDREA